MSVRDVLVLAVLRGARSEAAGLLLESVEVPILRCFFFEFLGVTPVRLFIHDFRIMCLGPEWCRTAPDRSSLPHPPSHRSHRRS